MTSSTSSNLSYTDYIFVQVLSSISILDTYGLKFSSWSLKISPIFSFMMALKDCYKRREIKHAYLTKLKAIKRLGLNTLERDWVLTPWKDNNQKEISYVGFLMRFLG